MGGGDTIADENLAGTIDTGTSVIGGQEVNVPGPQLKIEDNSGAYCFFSVATMKFGEENMEGAGTMDAELEESVVEEMSRLSGGIGPSGAATWLLGDTFMRQMYNVFDYDNRRYGIAELK